MTRKPSPNHFTGKTIKLVYNDQARELAHVSDAREYSLTHCAHLPMAERLARLEGLPLEVQS